MSRDVVLECIPNNSLLARIVPSDGPIGLRSVRADARAITLDKFCDEQGIEPTLLKIDVEGWEPEVVHGARALVARARPAILFEHNPRDRRVANIETLLADYRFYYVDDLSGQILAAGRPLDDLANISWTCNLFAIPQEEQARWPSMEEAIAQA